VHRSAWCRIAAGLALGWLGAVPSSACATAPSPLPDLPLGVAGDVHAIARQADGAMVIGGDFSMIDGVQRSHLARLRADGSLDPDWNPSVDGVVRALAVDASGRVYVGGSFDAVGGEPRHDIARIAAGRHGDVDRAWNPGRNIDATYGFAALAVGLHGDVFAAGEVAGPAQLGPHHAVKISAAGLIDPQWNPTLRSSVHAIMSDTRGFLYVVGGASYGEVAVHKVTETGHGDDVAGWRPAFDDLPHATAVGADGSLYVASSVFGFPAENGAAPRYVARISGSTGELDPAWNPPCSAPVTALAVDGDAVFAALGGNSTVEPQLARWSARTGDAAWRTPAEGVRVLAPAAGGSVYASGWGLPSRLALARLDGVDGHFLASADAAKPGAVHAIAVEPDGSKIIGGHFDVAGTTMRDNLLRLDPEGRLDATWHPSTELLSVDAIAIGAQGEVYASGESTAPSYQTASMIVRIDGDAGAIDPGWNVVVDGWVHALAPDTHGALYVGGYFAHVADLAREHFARLSLRDASVLPAWGTSMFPVNAIVVDDAEDALYLADGYGSYALPLGGGNSLARFSNATGSLRWRQPLPGMPSALALAPEGMLYVGGQFLTGDATNDVLAFTTAGEPDAPWNAATAVRGEHPAASALLVDAGVVVVGGSRYSDFPYVGTSSLVGRSRVDGSETVPLAVVDGTVIHAIVRAPDGIYVGGEFGAVDGVMRVGLAALADDPASPVRAHSPHARPDAPPSRMAARDAAR